MPKIHESSCECVYDNLELFDLPPTQQSIEDGTYDRINPITSIDKTNFIEFKIVTGEDYIDPSSLLFYVVQRILDDKGADLALDGNGKNTDLSAVAPVHLFHCARIKNVDVHLNNTLISESDNCYAYRQAIEIECGYSSDAKDEQLQYLFYAPDCGDFNTIAKATLVDGSITNKGTLQRYKWSANSKQFETFGALSTEITRQSKLIPPSCELRVRIQLNEPAFCLIAATAHNYQIAIDEACLLVRRHRVSSSLRVAHELELQKRNYIFNVRRIPMKYYTKGAGCSDLSVQNICSGRLPRRLVQMVVDADAFHGDVKHVPYQFGVHNMKTIILRRDTQPIPWESINIDEDKDLMAQAYMAFLQGTNRLMQDSGCKIDRERFKKGMTMLAYDLTPTMTDCGELTAVKDGTLSMEVRLHKALDKAVVVMFYLETEGVIQMNKDRQVSYK